MLGGSGLSHSSKLALLNANYIAERLKDHYTIRYKNAKGRVAHELLIDLAEFEKSAGLKVPDFAKRLQVCRELQPFLSVANAQTALLYAGLWLPPSHLLVAHLDCYADRAHGV